MQIENSETYVHPNRRIPPGELLKTPSRVKPEQKQSDSPLLFWEKWKSFMCGPLNHDVVKFACIIYEDEISNDTHYIHKLGMNGWLLRGMSSAQW